MMQRRKSNNNLVLYIAVPIALLFVAGAIGVIALVANKKGNKDAAVKEDTNYEQAVGISDQMVKEFENMIVVLESVQDAKSANAASKKIKQISSRIAELYKKGDKLKISDAEEKRLQQQFEARIQKLVPRLMAAAQSAAANCEQDPEFLKSLDELDSLEELVKG